MNSCFDLLLPRFDEAEDVCTQPLLPPLSLKPEEVRSRNLSSGSFASLESTDGSESEMGREETAAQLQDSSATLVDSCSSSQCENGREGGEKGVVVGGGKGKVKKVVMEDTGSGGGVEEEGGDVSSDDSDIEWVDVEPYHMASLAQMKENGFISQGMSISIQLPAQVEEHISL